MTGPDEATALANLEVERMVAMWRKKVHRQLCPEAEISPSSSYADLFASICEEELPPSWPDIRSEAIMIAEELAREIFEWDPELTANKPLLTLGRGSFCAGLKLIKAAAPTEDESRLGLMKLAEASVLLHLAYHEESDRLPFAFHLLVKGFGLAAGKALFYRLIPWSLNSAAKV